jgi:hypothetical protein
MLPEDKRSLFYSGTPYSRYQIAVFAFDMTKHLVHEAKTQNFDAKVKPRGVKEALAIEKSLVFVCHGMRRFDLEFGKELRLLGVNPYALARMARLPERTFNRVLTAYEGKTGAQKSGHSGAGAV